MVQECYKYVDAMTDLTIKLRLIDTLRTVTAGKVCTAAENLLLFAYFFHITLNADIQFFGCPGGHALVLLYKQKCCGA